MHNKLIYGIQQIGVGVDDASKAFEWYATRLGADISVFDDSNTATYMAPYMGGKPRRKRAIFALNMQGGSGYELWQYLDRKPAPPAHTVAIGDLGIHTAFVKTRNIQRTFDRFTALGEDIATDIRQEPDGQSCFYIRDPYGNMLKIKSFNSWFSDNGQDIGGNYGCAIGVSDIAQSMVLYADVLGYNQVVYDQTGVFEDLRGLPNGDKAFRRVLLTHSTTRVGGFSKLLGDSQIELIQCLEHTPNKIFEGRYWGDMGFIHVCFDIRNMKALTEECAAKGFPFQVLSAESFDMGEANGHWGYLEDCDGTLIEFVETHKVPLFKKLGLNINLKNRAPQQPLPNWVIKAMRFKRVKHS